MKVLLVGIDSRTIKLLVNKLLDWGHSVSMVDNGGKAIEFISENHIDILVITGSFSDKLLPQIRALNLGHYIYILMLTPFLDSTSIFKNRSNGPDDCLSEPVNFDELHLRLTLGSRIVSLESELNQKSIESNQKKSQTIELLSQFLLMFDSTLGSHCHRVGQMSLEIAKRHADVSHGDFHLIEAAGYLHDIGMIGLPTNLLGKQRIEMNGNEAEQYGSHPDRGERLLLGMDELKPIAEIVKLHHEQFNGRGFPQGLTGDEISLPASIVAAANLYDNFVYRQGILLKKIPESLQRCKGYQLSPDMVGILLDINLTRIEQEARQLDRSVNLSELREGMVISRDVVMKTGASMIAEGTRIDEHLIQKLKRYYFLGNIVNKVFIRID